MATTKFCLAVILASMLLTPCFADPWFWSSDKEEKKDQNAGKSSEKAARKETSTFQRIERILGRIFSYGKEYPKSRPMPTKKPAPAATTTIKDSIIATTTKSMSTAEGTKPTVNITKGIKTLVDHTKDANSSKLHIAIDKSPVHSLVGTHPKANKSETTVVNDSKVVAKKTTIKLTSEKGSEDILLNPKTTSDKPNLTKIVSDKSPKQIPECKDGLIDEQGNCTETLTDRSLVETKLNVSAVHEMKTVHKTKDKIPIAEAKNQTTIETNLTVAHEMKHMIKKKVSMPKKMHLKAVKNPSFVSNLTSLEDFLTDKIKSVISCVEGSCSKESTDTATTTTATTTKMPHTTPWINEPRTTISTLDKVTSKEITISKAEQGVATTTTSPMETTKTDAVTTTEPPSPTTWMTTTTTETPITLIATKVLMETELPTNEPVPTKNWETTTAETQTTITTEAPLETELPKNEPLPTKNWIKTRMREVPTTTTTTKAPIKTELPTTEPLPTPNWITTPTTEAPITTTTTKAPVTTQETTMRPTVQKTDLPCVPGQGKPCREIVKTNEPKMEPCTTPSIAGPCKKTKGWKGRKEHDSHRPKSSYRFNWEDIKIVEFFRRKFDPTYRGRYGNYYEIKYEKKYDPTFRQVYDNYELGDYDQDYRKQPEESESLNVIDEKHCKKIFSKEYVEKYTKICLNLFKDYVHEDYDKKCKKLAKNHRKIYYRKCKHAIKKQEDYDDDDDWVKEPQNKDTESWDWSIYWKYFLPSKDYGKIVEENVQPFMKKEK